MNSTTIRIEVSGEIYQNLISLQEEQKSITHKKPSLSSLILDYFQKGLTWSKNVQNGGNLSGNSEQNRVQNHENNVQNTREVSHLYVQNAKILAEKEEYLHKWEHKLREQMHNVHFERNELLDKKAELLEMKEDAIEKNHEVPILRMSIEALELENSNFKELNKNLEKEKLKLSLRLEKMESMDNRIQNSPFEKILPYAPAIISLLGIFILGKKLDNKTDLGSIQTKIQEAMKNLSPKDKEILDKKLEDILKMYVKNEKDSEKVKATTKSTVK